MTHIFSNQAGPPAPQVLRSRARLCADVVAEGLAVASLQNHWLAADTLLANLLAASGDCVKVLDLSGRIQAINPSGLTLWSNAKSDQILNLWWPALFHCDDRPTVVAALTSARGGELTSFEGRSIALNGEARDWRIRVAPIVGKSGNIEKLLAIAREVTLARAEEHRLRLVAEELQHRLANAFVVAQAIVTRTLRDCDNLEAGLETVQVRLAALSQAHTRLVNSGAGVTLLSDILNDAVTLHDPARTQVDILGPRVEIGPGAGLALTLAIHELCTNALKHGALACDAGRVTVRWNISADYLNLEWIESGGAPVRKPSRRGFGSQLIERALASPVCQTRIDYHPEGLRFVHRAPIADLAAN